jgi:hypothetical protein
LAAGVGAASHGSGGRQQRHEFAIIERGNGVSFGDAADPE